MSHAEGFLGGDCQYGTMICQGESLLSSVMWWFQCTWKDTNLEPQRFLWSVSCNCNGSLFSVVSNEANAQSWKKIGFKSMDQNDTWSPKLNRFFLDWRPKYWMMPHSSSINVSGLSSPNLKKEDNFLNVPQLTMIDFHPRMPNCLQFLKANRANRW